MRIVTTLLIAGLVLAGCGPMVQAQQEPTPDQKAEQATRQALGETGVGKIGVANLNRTTSLSSWRATVGDKAYACTADENFRLPACQSA